MFEIYKEIFFLLCDLLILVCGDANCKLWHQHFAHLDFAKILDLYRHDLVQGMHLKSHPHMGICEYCALGKHHRSPFHTSTSSHSRALLNWFILISAVLFLHQSLNIDILLPSLMISHGIHMFIFFDISQRLYLFLNNTR